MSANRNNNQRGGAANPGGRRPPNTVGAKAPPMPAWAFPPMLPASIQKLIKDDVQSINIVYTAYGVQIMVVYYDGRASVPLEQHLSADKAEKASRLLAEDTARLRERNEERQLGIQIPDFPNRESYDKFIKELPADTRRLIMMTNRDFRAQQGSNDVSEETGTQTAGTGGPQAPES